MRYGCYNSRAPALLAGGVVARPQGRLLVAPPRLADAPPPLHSGAVGRAVALSPVTAAADDHQPVAPRAVQYPVALLDEAAPATEDWTQRPPPAILSSTVLSSLWRWHRSPGSLVNPLQAWASSSQWSPCSTAPSGGWSPGRSVTAAIGEAVVCSLPARCRGGTRSRARTTSTVCARGQPDPGGMRLGASRSIRLQAEEEDNQIQEKTRSTRLAPGGENHIQRLCASRTRTRTTA